MSKKYLLFLFLGLWLVSCGTGEIKQEKLHAEWILTEGFRAEKSSDLLDGIKFNFHPDGKVETNFMGVDESGTYVLVKDEMTLETSKKTKFLIESLSDNELILTANLMGTSFKFVLNKIAN